MLMLKEQYIRCRWPMRSENIQLSWQYVKEQAREEKIRLIP